MKVDWGVFVLDWVKKTLMSEGEQVSLRSHCCC